MLSDEEIQGMLRALGAEVHQCPEAVRNHLLHLIRSSHENGSGEPLDGGGSGS